MDDEAYDRYQSEGVISEPVNSDISLPLVAQGEALPKAPSHRCPHAVLQPSGETRQGKTEALHSVWRPNTRKERVCPIFHVRLPVPSGYTAFSRILLPILMETLVEFSLGTLKNNYLIDNSEVYLSQM